MLLSATTSGGRAVLGDRYRDGEGVPQDDAEAVKWFRRAAEQGYAYAQRNLGRMYLFGKGVSEDFVEAYAWISVAATENKLIRVNLQSSNRRRMKSNERDETIWSRENPVN